MEYLVHYLLAYESKPHTFVVRLDGKLQRYTEAEQDQIVKNQMLEGLGAETCQKIQLMFLDERRKLNIIF